MNKENEEALVFAAKVFSFSFIVLLGIGLGGYYQYNGGWICPGADQVRVDGSCQPLEDYTDALDNYSLQELRQQDVREQVMEEENLTRRSVRKLVNDQASLLRFRR